MKQLQSNNNSSTSSDLCTSELSKFRLTPQLVQRLISTVPLDKSLRGCFASYLPSTAVMALLGHRVSLRDTSSSPVTCRNVERGLIAYLTDEIDRIIYANTSQLADEFVLIRLQSLLERMILHFGPDPKNPCFMRFLRIALKQFNYKTCLYLIQNGYVKMTSLADKNLRPDMLFLLLYYCRNHSSLVHTSSLPVDFHSNQSLSKSSTSQSSSSVNSPPIDGTSLRLLIQLLLPHADVNCYQVSHDSSALDLLVDLSESEILDNLSCNSDRKTLATVAHETMNMLIECKNVDISSVIDATNGKCNPIQRAVDQHKFTLALSLVKTTCKQCINVNKLLKIPSSIILSKSVVSLLQFVYALGYTLPNTEAFARSLEDKIIADPSHLFDTLIQWLETRRRHPWPLRALAWNTLREHEMLASSDLLNHYLLNVDLAEYMTGESFHLILT